MSSILEAQRLDINFVKHFDDKRSDGFLHYFINIKNPHGLIKNTEDVGDLETLGARRKLGNNSGVNRNDKQGDRQHIINVGIDGDLKVSKLDISKVEVHGYGIFVHNHVNFIDVRVHCMDADTGNGLVREYIHTFVNIHDGNHDGRKGGTTFARKKHRVR